MTVDQISSKLFQIANSPKNERGVKLSQLRAEIDIQDIDDVSNEQITLIKDIIGELITETPKAPKPQPKPPSEFEKKLEEEAEEDIDLETIVDDIDLDFNVDELDI